MIKKLLSNSELKNKTLIGRSDLSQFEKTAIHYFHEEGESVWIKWYNTLAQVEKNKAKAMFKIDDNFISKQRERNK